MTHVVTEQCFRCHHTNCAVVCPADCFHDGQRMLYIHPDACIDCEACVPECPANAIFPEDQLRAEDRPLRDLNAVMAGQTPPVRIGRDRYEAGFVSETAQLNGQDGAARSLPRR